MADTIQLVRWALAQKCPIRAGGDEDTKEGEIKGQAPRRMNHEDLLRFVHALDRSQATGIPLHVELLPPGHTDFGFSTTFPHCPRCKVEAKVERWKRKYSSDPVPCWNCAMTYSPAQTYSSVREDWVERELRDALGQAEFERFAVRYLAARGLTEQEARAAVGKEEQKERERRVKLVADREASERHSRYSEKVLFAGLRTLTRDPDEEGAGVFSLDDCVELLRRCESVGATVHWIMHLSDSGDLDADVEVRKFSNARAALEKLVADGCNERFAVTFKVPSTVVDSWCEQSRSSTTEV